MLFNHYDFRYIFIEKTPQDTWNTFNHGFIKNVDSNPAI